MERRLAAILAADVVGYSALMSADEVGTLSALKAHRRGVFDPLMQQHHGRIVKLIGDGVLVEFGSVVDAVEAALAVQQEQAGRDGPIALRIGINLGDVMVEGDDIYGDGVNIAARLEALAAPGGICISGTVHEQIRQKVGAVFVDQGRTELKNIPEPVAVWLWQSMPAPQGLVKGGKLALPEKPSIAVLPFVNRSGDVEQGYFADGVTEDIITGLSKCRWLFVIARNSVFTLRSQVPDIETVGRQLGVRYVLEGSVRKTGNRVRVTSQLIDAANGAHLWAEHYDRVLTDIFDLQDEITQNVVATIEPALRKAEIARVKCKRPGDFDAYDLYLRALEFMYDVKPESRAVALDFIEKALKIDPDYAEAHGVAAWCYFARSLWEGSLPDVHREAMLHHCRVIEDLRSDDASTLAHAAIALALGKRDYASALAMIDSAIALNPNSVHACGHGAVICTWAGYYDRAVEMSEMALRLSPFDPLRVMPLAGQAGAWMMKGAYENAIHHATLALRVYPTHTPSFLITIASLMRLGRIDEANAIAQKFAGVFPRYRIVPNAPVFENFVAELRAAGLPG